MYRLFLDANVMFTAAHNPDGKAAFLFQPAGRRSWALLSSLYAVEEARRNLAEKYPAILAQFEQLARALQLVGQPPVLAESYALVEKDRPILAAALAADATHLLTGDRKDFGHLMNKPGNSGGVVIQTVAEFLASL